MSLAEALAIRAEEPTKRTSYIIGACVAVLTLFVAWRATLGVSGYDDSYYVAIALRLAQGARPLADEWTLQVLGALPTVPFVLLWKALFGTSGIAFALRMLHVGVAVGVWYACYRALRPTFGAPFSAMAPALPLLAPPFSIFMLSYNTVSMLALMLASALMFAALRDGRAAVAVAAGVACGFAGGAYPPLVVPTALLLVAFSVIAWVVGRRRLILAVWLPPALMAGAVVWWLRSSSTLWEMQVALRYSQETWADVIKPWARRMAITKAVREAITVTWAWPLWALALVSAIPWRDRRVSADAAALIPLAALLPGFIAIERGVHKMLGWTPSGYAVYLVAGMTIAAVGWAIREHDTAVGVLLGFGGLVAAVGMPLVFWATSAGSYWAIPVVAMGALSMAATLGWLRLLRSGGVEWLPLAAWGMAAACLIALLLTNTFKDGHPFELKTRIGSGPLAGLATTPENRAWYGSLEAAGERLVRPEERVLVIGRPLGYLLLGGQMHTNAVWLNAGRSDVYTGGYYEKSGVYPDHIFLSTAIVDRYGGLEIAGGRDPLVRWLLKRYRLESTIEGYLHFVPARPLGSE